YAGGTVLVSNGTYRTAGRIVSAGLTNRVAIQKPLLLQSVNGPTTTIIQGNSTLNSTSVRCAYLTDGAVLSGFALTNAGNVSSGDNIKDLSGGGSWCRSQSSIIANCIIVGNSAAYAGGGAHSGTFVNCVLKTNSCSGGGGGAAESSLLANCLIIGNKSVAGGT